MSTGEEDLRKLNQQTFDAEEKKEIEMGDGTRETWDHFLRHVLASNFTIRRANRNAPRENMEQMIQTTGGRVPAQRTLSDVNPVVFENWNLGMVTCVATMNNKRYHNLKLFNRQPSSGEWQCAYWEVTEFTAG